MKKTLIGIISGFVLAVSVLAALPAQATVLLTATLSLTGFEAGPSPAFTYGVPNATAHVHILAFSSSTGWALNMPDGCVVPDSGAGNCFVKRVTIGGVNQEATANKVGNTQINFFITPTGGNEPSGAIEIEFEAGAVTVPVTNSNNMYSFSTNTTNAAQTEGDLAQIRFNFIPPTDTITFNSNGGSGSMSVQNFTRDGVLSGNSFTRSGYVFAGWATSQSDANAGTATYTNQGWYTMSGDVELFAVWTASGQSNGSSAGNATTTAATTPSNLATTGRNFTPLGLAGLLFLFSGVSVVAGSIVRKRRKS